jgi:hypothetical protein
MPTIFALLPISGGIPDSYISGFFKYPFTYPKFEKDAKQLPNIMNTYMESLKKTFKYFDKVKNLPFVAEGFKLLEEEIEHLHDVPKKPEPVEEPTSEPILKPAPKSASLPATIKPMASSLPATIKPAPVPAPASLPATIKPATAPSSLPATIKPVTP